MRLPLGLALLLLLTSVIADTWVSTCKNNENERDCHTNAAHDGIDDPCYWCNFHFTCWSKCDNHHQGELCEGKYQKYGQNKCQVKFRNLAIYLTLPFVIFCCGCCIFFGCVYLVFKTIYRKAGMEHYTGEYTWIK